MRATPAVILLMAFSTLTASGCMEARTAAAPTLYTTESARYEVRDTNGTLLGTTFTTLHVGDLRLTATTLVEIAPDRPPVDGVSVAKLQATSVYDIATGARVSTTDQIDDGSFGLPAEFASTYNTTLFPFGAEMHLPNHQQMVWARMAATVGGQLTPVGPQWVVWFASSRDPATTATFDWGGTSAHVESDERGWNVTLDGFCEYRCLAWPDDDPRPRTTWTLEGSGPGLLPRTTRAAIDGQSFSVTQTRVSHTLGAPLATPEPSRPHTAPLAMEPAPCGFVPCDGPALPQNLSFEHGQAGLLASVPWRLWHDSHPDAQLVQASLEHKTDGVPRIQWNFMFDTPSRANALFTVTALTTTGVGAAIVTNWVEAQDGYVHMEALPPAPAILQPLDAVLARLAAATGGVLEDLHTVHVWYRHGTQFPHPAGRYVVTTLSPQEGTMSGVASLLCGCVIETTEHDP